MNYLGASFEKNEAHLSEAIYDELVEDGEVMPTHPLGIPLPKWEKAYKQMISWQSLYL